MLFIDMRAIDFFQPVLQKLNSKPSCLSFLPKKVNRSKRSTDTDPLIQEALFYGWIAATGVFRFVFSGIE